MEIFVSQVQVGVGVIVNVKDKGIVLMKRKGSHGEGEWAFPGGKVDFGETILECAAREVMEEIGVELKNLKRIEHITEDFFPSFNKQFVTFYVYGETDEEPEIKEPEKASELKFIENNNLFGFHEPLFVGVKEIMRLFYIESLDEGQKRMFLGFEKFMEDRDFRNNLAATQENFDIDDGSVGC